MGMVYYPWNDNCDDKQEMVAHGRRNESFPRANGAKRRSGR